MKNEHLYVDYKAGQVKFKPGTSWFYKVRFHIWRRVGRTRLYGAYRLLRGHTVIQNANIKGSVEVTGPSWIAYNRFSAPE